MENLQCCSAPKIKLWIKNNNNKEKGGEPQLTQEVHVILIWIIELIS